MISIGIICVLLRRERRRRLNGKLRAFNCRYSFVFLPLSHSLFIRNKDVCKSFMVILSGETRDDVPGNICPLKTGNFGTQKSTRNDERFSRGRVRGEVGWNVRRGPTM